jgi:hypothetical protein
MRIDRQFRGNENRLLALAAKRLEANAWRPRANPWVIAITVTLATFKEALDSSIANVAMPHIGGSLAAGRERVHLGVDQLSDSQRRGSALQWMDCQPHRPQAFLLDLRGANHRHFPALRARSHSRRVGPLPPAARHGRRRPPAQRAIRPGRHPLSTEAQHGLRRLHPPTGSRAQVGRVGMAERIDQKIKRQPAPGRDRRSNLPCPRSRPTTAPDPA